MLLYFGWMGGWVWEEKEPMCRLDNIETQIDKAESSARSGTQHLGTAVKHQKRGTRTKLIIFGVLGAIAFFIILIVVLKLKD